MGDIAYLACAYVEELGLEAQGDGLLWLCILIPEDLACVIAREGDDLLVGGVDEGSLLDTIDDTAPGDICELAVDAAALQYAVSVYDAHGRLDDGRCEGIVWCVFATVGIIGLLVGHAAL